MGDLDLSICLVNPAQRSGWTRSFIRRWMWSDGWELLNYGLRLTILLTASMDCRSGERVQYRRGPSIRALSMSLDQDRSRSGTTLPIPGTLEWKEVRIAEILDWETDDPDQLGWESLKDCHRLTILASHLWIVDLWILCTNYRRVGVAGLPIWQSDQRSRPWSITHPDWLGLLLSVEHELTWIK